MPMTMGAVMANNAAVISPISIVPQPFLQTTDKNRTHTHARTHKPLREYVAKTQPRERQIEKNDIKSISPFLQSRDKIHKKQIQNAPSFEFIANPALLLGTVENVPGLIRSIAMLIE
ncbi:hypothetical protein A6X21_07775 [Planctopirus hydrillae]|uniref:Uncharacterized protein n=1 Tax=Planctopirus hydrillae TaxID=1841610 RepID=A0A1C3E8T9_9PLAN|nr:hypothetical protein A6X21_07775 [Planctopirus hydrillae]